MRDEINSCKWLFLRDIGEPEENSLRLVVEEAKADGPPEDIEVLPGKVIRGTRPIESDWTCRAFELVWASYVAYSVRNESYCALDQQELWEGQLLRRYTKSQFLDYVARGTFATADYPGPLRHWGVICLRHVVDVVATVDPEVGRINGPGT